MEIRVPDLGGVEAAEVVEVLVGQGDWLDRDDGLVTLESDKATMDVPSPESGLVQRLHVKNGDQVSEGDAVVTLEVGETQQAPAAEGTVARDSGGVSPPAVERRQQPQRVTVEETGPQTPAASKADVNAEVLVLGSGPGGYSAAFRAADLGKRVVLVERYPILGGVCLNVGCIPSKALLHAARVIEEAAYLAQHGVELGKPRIDLEKLRAWQQGVVKRLTDGLGQLATKRKVEILQGTGAFVSDRQLEVSTDSGSRTVTFEQAIIAAGSRSMELPGIDHQESRVLDSTGALELESVPRRLLVIGGGIIGLEMATIYAALGSEITVVELTPGLMPGCDRDLVKPLEKRLKARHRLTIHLGTRVAEVRGQKRGLKVVFEGEKAPEPAVFDRVLVAVGRRPNSDRIGTEAAGLEIDEKGFIRVDNQQRTNRGHIFAIGDIVGPPMLAHKASHEGKVAAEVACGLKRAFDARVIASVSYTDPEIAWVGLTETEAREKGLSYEKGRFPWAASGRALGMGRDEGITKLLFDPESKRLLGAGIVGPNAGDLISEAALAIEMGCEAADLGLTVHPHPTLSETVAFAAEAFEGTLTELYLPKRK
jgi:dihydrolipoamide dehydrogenase